MRLLDQVVRLMHSASEQEICLELSRLAGVVKLHLALEDQHMYPRMLEHTDTVVQQAAHEYKASMAEFALEYVAFHDKWMRNGAVSDARLEFIKEFKGVSDVLRARISHENQGLYDLIDQKDIKLAS
ncbi:MAG: hypothetical protein JO165_12505 [Candidatus Eremiobacteraeota bacterium]|nr:hypothetical protein [Candidatus Eremiobacteraeota bacterium]